MFRIKDWFQANKGDRDGTIRGSFNLRLDNGKVKVAPKMILNTSSDDDAQLLFPWAIVYNPQLGQWQVGAGDKMFVGGNLPNGAFTESEATTPPFFANNQRPDLAVIAAANGDYYTFGTEGGEIYLLALDGTSWSQVSTFNGGNNGAPLIAFKNRVYMRFAFDGMVSVDYAGANDATVGNPYAITFNDKTRPIQCGSKSNSHIFLGTSAPIGSHAVIYKWNGSSSTPESTTPVPAQAVLAMGVAKNTNWAILSTGVLVYDNGGQYLPVARLPFKKNKYIKPFSTATQSSANLVHYNGLAVEDDKIYINVNPVYIDGTSEELCPSGKWCYDITLGCLYHMGSPSASSTEFGSHKITSAGALAIAKVDDADSNGSILAGYSFLSDATTTKYGIFYDDFLETTAKAGFLITPRIYSEQIKDTWNKLNLFIRKFQDESNKIVAKYRTEEIDPTEITLTWASDTTFTTSTSLTGKTGYEVEILCGSYAGKSAHISSISGNTITLDDTFSEATGTAKARVTNWKKMGEITESNIEWKDFYFNKATNGLNSKWVQIKLWMRHKGDDSLDEILVTNKVFQPAN